jgi:hypothetical protein
MYAIWNRTVSYDLNGASGTAPSSTTAVATSAITLAATQGRDGYSFAAWGTAADGSGTSYQAGGSYPANQPTRTLYALWRRTVTFDANGGTGAPAAVSSLDTSAMSLPATAPTREGWRFVRWDTEADGTGTAYQPGDSYAAGLASATLHAVWERRVTSVALGHVSAKRVSGGSSTTEADEGTYAYVRVPYVVSGAAKATIAVTATCTYDEAGETRTKQCTVSGGTATKPEGEDAYSGVATVRASGCATDTAYRFELTVTATNASATQAAVSAGATVVLQTAHYTLDVRAGGHGVSFGAPARGDWHNVSMPNKAYEQPDLAVITFTNMSASAAATALAQMPAIEACLVLLDDGSLWRYTRD